MSVYFYVKFNVYYNRSKLKKEQKKTQVLLHCLTLSCTSVSEKEQITMWILNSQLTNQLKGTDFISIIKK